MYLVPGAKDIANQKRAMDLQMANKDLLFGTMKRKNGLKERL